MYTLTNIREELKTKERRISDLIRFIQTRTDDNPNYSLLLGAGCSITSGVRSATELIEIWKREISQEQGINVEKINNETWFNIRNSYSSLFEKKYDLPRQRRMFVEQEVRDKIPSIGYAYLVKLVECNFFKTIFTTNFDDLLNEAFYQFSSHRPIVCAHDSGISSITVTSKRPKIVKLHGDYLFDDIKSTLRETESLEENIKNKFTEFAKDYGLIVVGYGGNDRSVVDVITYLLKNEEYFKHGIYWCLMKDSIINDDLKKLLWKDRVYYVEIDGFDELFAELNSKLNNGRLPIDNDFLNNRKKELLIKLTSNEYLKKSDCQILLDDFKSIEKNLEIDVVQNFFKYMSEKDTKERLRKKNFKKKGVKHNIEQDEEAFLSEIQLEVFSGNYLSTLHTIDLKLKGVSKDSRFYLELLKVKVRCLRLLKRKEETISCYEELISIDSSESYDYHLMLSRMHKDYTKKILVLDKAIASYKYNYEAYHNKADIMFSKYKSSIVKTEKELSFSLDDLLALVNQSIDLNPSIDNDSWVLKFEIIEEINSKNTDNLIKEIEELIKHYEKQDVNHPSLIIMKVNLMDIKKEKKESIYNTISSAIEDSTEIDFIKLNELTMLRQYAKYNDLALLSQRFQLMEDTYEIDEDYLLLKANLLLKKYDKLKESIKILEDIKSKNKEVFHTLFDYYIFDDQIDKAEEILEKHFPDDISQKIELLDSKGEYKQIIDLLDSSVKEEPNLIDIIQLIYYKLQNKDYKDAENMAFKYLNRCNYNSIEIHINYAIAAKRRNKLGEKERAKIREKIIESKNASNLQLAAAHAVLDDENKTYKYLKLTIEDNYKEKYRTKKWVVFEQYMNKQKFKELYNMS